MKLILLVITLSLAYVAYGVSVNVNAEKPIDFGSFKSTFKKTYNSPTETQNRYSTIHIFLSSILPLITNSLLKENRYTNRI